MLQFNHSQQTNTNAVYPNVTASLGTTEVLLKFTETYDQSTTDNIIADVINTVGGGNPWVVFQLTGSSVPTPSGQYDVEIWQFTGIPGGLGIWSEQNTLWAATNATWNSGPGGYQKDVLLSTERAYVSGSNETSITQYLSPNQNGTYTTYNG